ncbi:hemin uptake protein HemP [Escherichia coli]|nr:hemin uptake protein HemP [Escherichia coli]
MGISAQLVVFSALRRISSQTLLGPDGKLIIDHDGQEYLLRKTQAGKLGDADDFLDSQEIKHVY